MSVDSSYIHDSSGAIIGHIELIVDISEAENLRKEAAEAAVRSRLETVSALEGVVEIVPQPQKNFPPKLSNRTMVQAK
jgi:hypothetical protein